MLLCACSMFHPLGGLHQMNSYSLESLDLNLEISNMGNELILNHKVLILFLWLLWLLHISYILSLLLSINCNFFQLITACMNVIPCFVSRVCLRLIQKVFQSSRVRLLVKNMIKFYAKGVLAKDWHEFFGKIIFKSHI